MEIKFGPAGNCDLFKQKGYKATVDAPKFVAENGLNAYEVQFGRGVKMSAETAMELGSNAALNGVSLSVHAPYYISLSSVEEEKRLNSVNYIMDSVAIAKIMGATRVVIHSGSCSKISREKALELAKDTLKITLDKMDSDGYSDIILCPETMGKINQLGDLNEVMELCRIDDRLIPTIDFGHLNARTFGGSNDQKAFMHILDTIENKLGSDRLKIFHSHFSKIEYTEKGGEKKHLTFKDEIYGPNFEPLAELIYKKSLTPTFICESAGTQTIDAKTMLDIYNTFKDK